MTSKMKTLILIEFFSHFRKIMSEEIEQSLNERKGFSSESFKIEIQNLPKFFGIGQIKKVLIKKLNLKPHKLKPVGSGAKYMFVNFSNEEDREEAIAKLDGYELKGNKLRAFKARAAKDPMVKAAEENKAEEVTDDRPITERIKSAVVPLADKDYKDQLAFKKAIIQELLAKLKKDFMKQNGFFKSHGITDEDLVHLDEFIPSPIINGYRNKCEFSVGKHPETNEISVGFRLSSYKKGCTAVANIDHLNNVSDQMKSVVKHFEDFVKNSNYEPFDNVSHQGYWKQLTVRQGIRTNNLLVWAVLHPQELKDDEKVDLEQKLVHHFEGQFNVTSLNIQYLGPRQKGQPDPPVKCILGQKYIEEQLMNLTFKVSPQAFFQINTPGAEKLYEACGSIADLDKQTILFDVCCGTGTIGLCLASKVKEVHGVDIIEEAVEDARANALANSVNNANFHAGRAEFVLPELLKKYDQTEGCKTVAIVDPPRSGLHPKAVLALRASNVDTLVYVSCDAKAAMNNFIDLGRMTSNAYKGEPFYPTRVIPVDLFPHTKHFELIILFKRFPLKQALNC